MNTPLPSPPTPQDPSWRAVYGEIEFDSGHWGVFENAIDMAHIHYLHGDRWGGEGSVGWGRWLLLPSAIAGPPARQRARLACPRTHPLIANPPLPPTSQLL
jgi:hypothetical protein